MNDEIRAISVFDGKLLANVMSFNDSQSGDLVDERVVIAEVTDTEADEIEIGFDMFSPKRRVYLRFNKGELAIILSEAMR